VAGKRAANKEAKKMKEFVVASFLVHLEELPVLEAVGAAADPVRGEDKVVAIAAAVVVVMPVLPQQTQPTGKHSTCSGDPRNEHQNDQSNAYLSNRVYPTTQAWLIDCDPHD
jgi:hypothetical protein